MVERDRSDLQAGHPRRNRAIFETDGVYRLRGNDRCQETRNHIQ